MEASVYSIEGKEVRKITLDDAVFGRDVSDGAIYYAIRNELANRRVGTAKTKTRSEVRYSGSKLWRQKGTGRARVGSRRSPIWVGGGTIFGPQPRDYSYRVPKKMKRAAFKSLLSQKAQEEKLQVIEDFTVESGKTKDLVQILKNFVQDERTVFILQDDNELIRRAGRNIPWLRILNFNRLNAHELFYGKKVLVLESAANSLNEFYGKGE
jgi:large subunit ribosomal protein L4